MAVVSIAEVADVVMVRGVHARPETTPALVVEVPHGADQRAHYDACRARLVGTFPHRLEDFFHVNTDEGAWELGLATARQFVGLHPEAVVRLIRCLVPRTFIDCNRVIAADHTAAGGGVTAGLPVYVEHPDDQAYLLSLHRAYCALVDEAMAAVVAGGGRVLVPHSYSPRTVGIATVSHDIVEQLHRAWSPRLVETWPLRGEVDVITKDADGRRLCPDGSVERLVPALAAIGLTTEECGAYWLHPATRAAVLSARHPGHLLCLEVRRDLLMDGWTPFAQSLPNRPFIDRVGRVIAGVLSAPATGPEA